MDSYIEYSIWNIDYMKLKWRQDYFYINLPQILHQLETLSPYKPLKNPLQRTILLNKHKTNLNNFNRADTF